MRESAEFISGAWLRQLYVQLRDRQVTRLELTFGKTGLAMAIVSVPVITYAMYSLTWAKTSSASST